MIILVILSNNKQISKLFCLLKTFQTHRFRQNIYHLTMKKIFLITVAFAFSSVMLAGKPKLDPTKIDSLLRENDLLMQKVEMLMLKVEMLNTQIQALNENSVAQKGQIDDIKAQNKQFFSEISEQLENVSNSNGSMLSGVCGPNLKWKFKPNTGVLDITGTGAMTDFTGGAPWSKYSSSIIEINLPDGITNIGKEAFRCTGITSIAIPNSVTSIGSIAFESCMGLTTITLPNGLKEIEVEAFSDCANLTTVIIPQGLREIGVAAFIRCEKLRKCDVPRNVILRKDKLLGTTPFSHTPLEERYDSQSTY